MTRLFSLLFLLVTLLIVCRARKAKQLTAYQMRKEQYAREGERLLEILKRLELRHCETALKNKGWPLDYQWELSERCGNEIEEVVESAREELLAICQVLARYNNAGDDVTAHTITAAESLGLLGYLAAIYIKYDRQQ